MPNRVPCPNCGTDNYLLEDHRHKPVEITCRKCGFRFLNKFMDTWWVTKIPRGMPVNLLDGESLPPDEEVAPSNSGSPASEAPRSTPSPTGPHKGNNVYELTCPSCGKMNYSTTTEGEFFCRECENWHSSDFAKPVVLDSLPPGSIFTDVHTTSAKSKVAAPKSLPTKPADLAYTNGWPGLPKKMSRELTVILIGVVVAILILVAIAVGWVTTSTPEEDTPVDDSEGVYPPSQDDTVCIIMVNGYPTSVDFAIVVNHETRYHEVIESGFLDSINCQGIAPFLVGIVVGIDDTSFEDTSSGYILPVYLYDGDAVSFGLDESGYGWYSINGGTPKLIVWTV